MQEFVKGKWDEDVDLDDGKLYELSRRNNSNSPNQQSKNRKAKQSLKAVRQHPKENRQ